MAENSGTIPAIKQRPKVAKRPTIPAIPVPKQSPKTAKNNSAASLLVARKTSTHEQKPMKALAPPKAIEEVAQSANEPVCAVALTVPAAMEATKAMALALPAAVENPWTSDGAVRLNVLPVPAVSLALAASTIPPVRERPRVAKRSTLTVPKTTGTMVPAKKPLVKTTAEPREKQPSLATNWVSWAPLAVGIVLGFLAPQLHALAAQWDPWGLRIVFPLVQVLGLRELGMSDELTRTLPQLMLYLQFPLEGLLVAMNLRRGATFSMAIGPIPGLHFICGLVLWIVALGSLKPI